MLNEAIRVKRYNAGIVTPAMLLDGIQQLQDSGCNGNGASSNSLHSWPQAASRRRHSIFQQSSKMNKACNSLCEASAQWFFPMGRLQRDGGISVQRSTPMDMPRTCCVRATPASTAMGMGKLVNLLPPQGRGYRHLSLARDRPNPHPSRSWLLSFKIDGIMSTRPLKLAFLTNPPESSHFAPAGTSGRRGVMCWLRSPDIVRRHLCKPGLMVA